MTRTRNSDWLGRKARCINNGVWFHRWHATSQKRACTDGTETLLNKQNLLVIFWLLARQRRQVVPQSTFQSPASNFSSVQKSRKATFQGGGSRAPKERRKYRTRIRCASSRAITDIRGTRWVRGLLIFLYVREDYFQVDLYNIPYKIELSDVITNKKT